MYEAGNEGQAKADRTSENERERIVLNELVRRAVQCTILVCEFAGRFQIRRKTLLKAISMVEIDLESKRHTAHPYRERQKERKRKVREKSE